MRTRLRHVHIMNTFYQCITDFIFVQHPLQKADVIFVPGNRNPAAARHAAALYHEGWAPLLLPSGRFAKAAGHFDDPSGKGCQSEWEFLRNVLLEEGVPAHAILQEDRATFTWENAIFSKEVLKQQGIAVNTAILSCQAFHARRSLMYYQEQFPDVTFCVSPVVTRNISAENWYLSEEGTQTVLGEMERIGKQFHCVLPLGAPGVSHML